MDFSFKPRLSKELILECISEEEIMSRYLGVPITKKLFCSPLRNDHKPTCGFFRNKNGTLMFKDFGTGNCYNCFNMVMEMFHCDYWDALKKIANDFHILESDIINLKGYVKKVDSIKIKDTKPTKIQVEIKDYTDKELKWWKRYGIDKDCLDKYKVYSCAHVFVNDRIVAEATDSQPIYGYYGNQSKQTELWRCYFPKRKTYRFLSNWPAKKLQGYDQLPKTAENLVITKSMKDCMCFNSIGIAACAPCSETLFVESATLDNLKKRFKNIVVLYDNDEAGISNILKIEAEHPDLKCVFIPTTYKSKDISDFYKNHGKEKTKEFINDYLL